MIFRQLFDSTSFTYTYLIGSRKGGEAVIIDPVLEKVDHYLRLFEELDLTLVKAIDTHLHADHITGLGALRDSTHCITVMGEHSKVDVVSMRIADGDSVQIEDIRLRAMYTPGHTDDSYCFHLNDRVFTGDTLFIRGTGRTDFQNGDPVAQYNSIFNGLLKLPDDTLVFPGHDYKGDTVSTIAEERVFNPRLQVSSAEEYADIMNNLNLPNPKMMDVAVPANLHIGLRQDALRDRGQNLDYRDAFSLVGRPDILLVDLREEHEIRRHGLIQNAFHIRYQNLHRNLLPGGLLFELARATGKRIVFYCAHGERSAMAVEDAEKAGLPNACHIEDGIEGWKSMGGPVADWDSKDR
jgi:glyoxylase-like metal-dependent hydrolase (beta-lactamase superfamily II)/rhodanese-related sulfurtransferase